MRLSAKEKGKSKKEKTIFAARTSRADGFFPALVSRLTHAASIGKRTIEKKAFADKRDIMILQRLDFVL